VQEGKLMNLKDKALPNSTQEVVYQEIHQLRKYFQKKKPDYFFNKSEKTEKYNSKGLNK
jgi:hypothetical protein